MHTGDPNTDRIWVYGDYGGSIPDTGKYVVIDGTSDIRFKDNIKDSKVDALEIVNKIKIREFDWNTKDWHQKIGMVADELEELDPDFVIGSNEGDDYKSVSVFYLVGYLTKAIQQLSETVEAQQKRIAFLEDLSGYVYVDTKKGGS